MLNEQATTPKEVIALRALFFVVYFISAFAWLVILDAFVRQFQLSGWHPSVLRSILLVCVGFAFAFAIHRRWGARVIGGAAGVLLFVIAVIWPGPQYSGAVFLSGLRIGGNLPVHFKRKDMTTESGCLVFVSASDYFVRVAGTQSGTDCHPRASFFKPPSLPAGTELKCYRRDDITEYTFIYERAPVKQGKTQ